ncbi:MAG: universal stress protein [Pseudomonadota bacterium]|nr:universal stress protein [Pseudomonadota bacterium]
MYSPPPIRSILVPTDFSDGAELAFAHALRLSVALRARLDIVHVEPENDAADWRWGPHVGETLRRWGYDTGTTPSELEALGVRRTIVSGSEPDAAILAEIASSHADLVVMSTHGRAGLERWLRPSVTEAVLRRRPVPILLLPSGCRTFVDLECGAPSLKRILVPIATAPNPAPGFDAALTLLRAFGGEGCQLATVHVGEGQPGADLLRPPPGLQVFHWNVKGAVVDEILAIATTWTADLMVVVSEGRRDLFDELRGSTVERLVARSPVPVLVVPAEWGSRDAV